MSKVQLAWDAPIAPKDLACVLDWARGGGFMALVMSPAEYPLGFAFCFLCVPTPLPGDPGQRLCSLLVSARSGTSELVTSAALRYSMYDKLPEALESRLREFGGLIGLLNHTFVRSLDQQFVALERTKALKYARQLSPSNYYALGRIAEHARELRLLDGTLQRGEVIFRDKLRSALASICHPQGEVGHAASM